MMRCIALSPASNAISKQSAMFNSRQINKLAFQYSYLQYFLLFTEKNSGLETYHENLKQDK